MSRPGASGSQSSPADDVSRSKLPHPDHQMSRTQPRQGVHSVQSNSPHEPRAVPTVFLPPLRQFSRTPPTPSSERRPGNPLGVQSILNPQSSELLDRQRVDQRGRRRSASQMESPSPVDSHPPQSLPSISRPTSVDSTQDDPAVHNPFPVPRGLPTRHILSPRSPTIHRTQSLSVLKPPTGTIDAHQSPFLFPSTRPSGPETGPPQAALPTPPAALRASYFPTVPPTAPTPPPGLIRSDFRRQSTGFPQSGSASPMASYSPYSQPASVASSQFEPSSSSQPGSYMSLANSTHGQEFQNPRIPVETERGLIPMTPSVGANSIQIMTIKSSQGPLQIPVDVQAASKVADEKRKRNAGASARFRARRKEKEREASMSIARLEQQLRDATEDSEFYRNERDFFRSIVLQQPGADRRYPRPSSPRHRRLSGPLNAPLSAGGSGSSYSGFSEPADARESERNVRRRTSSYHPPQGATPAPLNESGPQPQSYPSPAVFPPINPPLQPGLPVNRPPPQPQQQFNPREQRSLPDFHQPPLQRPVLRDPFAAEPARYESQNWPHGPGPDSRRQ